MHRHESIIDYSESKTMEQYFGIGEGRLLLRGAALAADAGVRGVKASGGNRKIVYCTDVPARLVSNFRPYVFGLHGKVAWKQDKILQGHARSWPATDGCEIRVLF